MEDKSRPSVSISASSAASVRQGGSSTEVDVFIVTGDLKDMDFFFFFFKRDLVPFAECVFIKCQEQPHCFFKQKKTSHSSFCLSSCYVAMAAPNCSN